MPRTEQHSRIIVFAKAPRPGAVKTRLIPLLGAPGAAALHARMVEHTLSVAAAAARFGTLQLHTSCTDDLFIRRCAEQYGATLVQQSGGNLGERMRTAFDYVFNQDSCTSAVLVGSDCPALTPTQLSRALQALEQGHDAVFAPAEDGGYVLVGLARLDPRIFADVEWSTDRVMAQTRDRLKEMGWRWLELETLWDVDEPHDYQRLVESGLVSPI
ncbi:MAG: TIGR04282 family arsenosugar biosynthesis glycosyltransferase [Pseudomonadota bacterium]